MTPEQKQQRLREGTAALRGAAKRITPREMIDRMLADPVRPYHAVRGSFIHEGDRFQMFPLLTISIVVKPHAYAPCCLECYREDGTLIALALSSQRFNRLSRDELIQIDQRRVELLRSLGAELGEISGTATIAAGKIVGGRRRDAAGVEQRRDQADVALGGTEPDVGEVLPHLGQNTLSLATHPCHVSPPLPASSEPPA